MKILLDENLPRKLVAALRDEGHTVESIHTLRMQGLDNGSPYRFAMANFDLCFTRDAGFPNNVRRGPAPANVFKLSTLYFRRNRRMNLSAIFYQPSAALTGVPGNMVAIGLNYWPQTNSLS